jgi:8-oxo-dGTP pyrophosphatase MutT (NUDIX family)
MAERGPGTRPETELSETSTWDGRQIAAATPQGSSIVVRRLGPAGRFSYLLVHRAVNGADYEGDWAWTPPAGARQPGEAIFPATLRELDEETGIVSDDVWAVDLSSSWAALPATFRTTRWLSSLMSSMTGSCGSPRRRPRAQSVRLGPRASRFGASRRFPRYVSTSGP